MTKPSLQISLHWLTISFPASCYFSPAADSASVIIVSSSLIRCLPVGRRIKVTDYISQWHSNLKTLKSCKTKHTQTRLNKTTVFYKTNLKLFTLKAPGIKQPVSEKRISLKNGSCFTHYGNSSFK